MGAKEKEAAAKQPFPVFSHSTLYIVEGSAKAVSVFSYNTVNGCA